MPKILENPREKILKEACILLDKGYNNFNIREIAKACDFSLGTVYNYFKNKTELIIEVFNIKWNETLEEIKETSDLNISFEEKISLIYEKLDKFLIYHRGVFLEISREKIKCKEKKEHNLSKYKVFDELYLILDNIIETHKSNKEISIEVETRKLTAFFINNMINISMKSMDLTIEEFLYIALNKL